MCVFNVFNVIYYIGIIFIIILNVLFDLVFFFELLFNKKYFNIDLSVKVRKKEVRIGS